MITYDSSGHGEVRVSSTNDVTLAGTYAGVTHVRASTLLLNGSGPVDRDSIVRRLHLGLNPALADALASIGVSSFCFDKRGSGQTGGDFFTATMTDNYHDAKAAFEWLRNHEPDIPTFVIGHSEGALHAAHLAAEDDQAVTGVVLIACPVRRGEEILTWQAKQILPTLPPITRAILRMLRFDPLKSQEKAFEKIRSTSGSTVRVQGKKLNAGWLRQFMDYDPVPVFKGISVPILVVGGTHDMQVPPEDEQEIREIVRGPCDVRMITDVSHLLRLDPEFLGPRGYKKAVKESVSSEVLNTIATWISTHLEPTTAARGGHEGE